MKKITFLLLGIIAFYSCANDVDTINNSESKFVAELNVSDAMLTFKSEQEMKETIASLLVMNETELVNWYKKNNPDFISQEMLYREAINDLTLINNFEEAEVFKSKYSPYLMFNDDPADEELYDPWLPNEDFPGLSYVANKDGNVEVAGEILNLNRHTAVDQITAYKMRKEFKNSTSTRAFENVMNYMFVEKNKRRMWVESGRDRGYAVIFVRAQLKNWLGWNKYQADWTLQLPSGALPYFGELIDGAVLRMLQNPDRMVKAPNVANNSGILINETKEIKHPITGQSYNPKQYGQFEVKFHIWTSGLSKDETGIFHYKM